MSIIRLVVMAIVGGLYGAWMGYNGIHFLTLQYLSGLVFMMTFYTIGSVRGD